MTLKHLSRAVSFLLLLTLPTSAFAQFQKSDAKVYIDWPQLEVGPTEGYPREAVIYAVMDGYTALYTISLRSRSNSSVLGAFQCNKEFTILKSSTNGFYDIRCVDENMFEERFEYILKAGTDGVYIQKF